MSGTRKNRNARNGVMIVDSAGSGTPATGPLAFIMAYPFQSKYIAKCIEKRPRFRYITLGKDYDVITLISSRTPPEILIVADDGKYRRFCARWFEVRERE